MTPLSGRTPAQPLSHREKLWLAVVVARWAALSISVGGALMRPDEPWAPTFNMVAAATAVAYTSLVTFFRWDILRLSEPWRHRFLAVDVVFGFALLSSDTNWLLYSVTVGMTADMLCGLGVGLAVSCIGMFTYIGREALLDHFARGSHSPNAFLSHAASFPAWVLLFAYPHRLARELEERTRELAESKAQLSAANRALYDSLTQREKEILRLIAGGFSNQEIATKTSISLATVKTHTNNLFKKLHVNSRVQAANRLYSFDPALLNPIPEPTSAHSSEVARTFG